MHFFPLSIQSAWTSGHGKVSLCAVELCVSGDWLMLQSYIMTFETQLKSCEKTGRLMSNFLKHILSVSPSKWKSWGLLVQLLGTNIDQSTGLKCLHWLHPLINSLKPLTVPDQVYKCLYWLKPLMNSVTPFYFTSARLGSYRPPCNAAIMWQFWAAILLLLPSLFTIALTCWLQHVRLREMYTKYYKSNLQHFLTKQNVMWNYMNV